MRLKIFIKNNLIFLLPILSGILLILAYPPYDLEFLIWIALIPLFWFLALKQTSPKKAFFGGTICGILFFGKLFSWIFATAPFEWLGITARKDLLFTLCLLIILWLVQTVFLSLFFGGFAWILKLSFKNSSKLSFLTIPALWIILEYLRAWGFGILWFGKETLLGSHWTFGNLAYTLHNQTNLIQVADLGGIYLISFLIVLVNAGLFLVFRKRSRAILTILILIAVAWGGYGAYKTNMTYRTGEARAIALLQTNFLSGSELNPYQKKEAFKTVLGLFKAGDEADIIIAPEGFGIVSLTEDPEIARYLLKDFWQPGQIYLENEKIIEAEKIKSRLFYYDLEKESPLGYHDKTLLVPNGEFLPYLTKALLSIYSFDLERGQRFYSKGDKIAPTQNIGATICSSILSPNIQRQMTKKGAEFLTVVSSDAPFHGSKSLLSQNLAMSKLRAVENRRYFSQATNMGYSFLLDPKGKILAKGSELGNEILFSDIYLLNKKAIYTKFGDWIIVLAILSTVLLTSNLCYNKKSP